MVAQDVAHVLERGKHSMHFPELLHRGRRRLVDCARSRRRVGRRAAGEWLDARLDAEIPRHVRHEIAHVRTGRAWLKRWTGSFAGARPGASANEVWLAIDLGRAGPHLPALPVPAYARSLACAAELMDGSSHAHAVVDSVLLVVDAAGSRSAAPQAKGARAWQTAITAPAEPAY